MAAMIRSLATLTPVTQCQQQKTAFHGRQFNHLEHLHLVYLNLKNISIFISLHILFPCKLVQPHDYPMPL